MKQDREWNWRMRCLVGIYPPSCWIFDRCYVQMLRLSGAISTMWTNCYKIQHTCTNVSHIALNPMRTSFVDSVLYIYTGNRNKAEMLSPASNWHLRSKRSSGYYFSAEISLCVAVRRITFPINFWPTPTTSATRRSLCSFYSNLRDIKRRLKNGPYCVRISYGDRGMSLPRTWSW